MYKDTHKDIILRPRKAITMLEHLKNASSILGREKLKILHPRISFISLIRTYDQAKSIIIWLCSCPFGKYHPLLQSGLRHNAPKMAGIAHAHYIIIKLPSLSFQCHVIFLVGPGFDSPVCLIFNFACEYFFFVFPQISDSQIFGYYFTGWWL